MTRSNNKFKRTNWLTMLIVFSLLIQIASPMIALAAEIPEGEITIDAIVKINGNVLVSGTPVTITPTTQLRIDFPWAIDDAYALSDGDTLTIALPEVIDLFDAFSGATFVGVLDSSHGPAGTYTIDKANKTLIIQFDETLTLPENLLGRIGTVWLEAKFDLTKFEDNATKDVLFSAPVNKTFQVIMKPTTGGNSITKKGTANAALNATSIEWEIDINTGLDLLGDITVTDTITPVLPKTNVRIYELNVGYLGDLSQGTLINGAATFPINLSGSDKAYRIIYDTVIPSGSTATSYTNNALLTIDGGPTVAPVIKTVNTPKGSLITKIVGVPNANPNPTKIHWVVDANKSKSTIDNVHVVDSIPVGLGLELLSLKVYNLNISALGSETIGSEIFPSITSTTAGFDIDLGNITGAYRIEYDTDINYGAYQATQVFTNTATITGNSITPDSATNIATVNRAPLITKTGVPTVNYTVKEIKWEVVVNSANSTITNAKVIDTFGSGLDIGILSGIKMVPGSLKVYDETGLVEITTGITVTELDYSFEVDFGTGPLTQKRIIKYTTTIEDYNKTPIGNTATLEGDGVGETVNAPIDQDITPGIANTYDKVAQTISQTLGGMTYRGIDYAEKTMSWRLDILPVKAPVTALTITDTVPVGSLFLDNTLKIRRGTSLLLLGTDYTVAPLGTYGTGFIIEFTGALPLTGADYHVYYKTSFDPDKVTVKNTTRNYTNTAQFDGTSLYNGITTPINTNVPRTQQISQLAFNNGSKSVSLRKADREIDWQIHVNQLAEAYSTFVVTDTISEGQQLINAFEVIPFTLNNFETRIYGTALATTEYTATPTTIPNGFTLSFNNPINSGYVIKYTTEIVGISKTNYDNKAVISGLNAKGETTKTYTANVNYPLFNTFLRKEASGNVGVNVYIDDQVDWTVTINESLSEIATGAVFTDTIGKGHVYLNGSIKVTSGGFTVDPLEYGFVRTPIVGGGETLEVTFNTPIDKVYVITYSTIVIADTGEVVKNSAEFNGVGTSGIDDSVKTYTAVQSSGSTGTAFNRGKITIKKVDSITGDSINLPTQFRLYYDLNGTERTVYNGPMSTVNGELVYNNIPFRTYYLEELVAPTGYKFNPLLPPIEITLSSAERIIPIQVKNTKIAGGITFNKVGEKGEGLAGAVFSIYASTDTTFTTSLQEATSNALGEVTFTDITFGSYVIRETSPPTGYLIDLSPMPVTIVDDQITVNLANFGNAKIRGNIRLIKQDSTGGVLAGAEFKLYDENGDELTFVLPNATSNALGEVLFENVPYGVYTIKEINAPSGYVKSNAVGTATITVEGATVTATPEIYLNTLIVGDVEVRKTDTKGNPLDNAVFSLMQGTTEFYTATTVNGSAVFKDVDYGVYDLIEKTAPNGYVKNNEKKTVVISVKGAPIQIFNFVNLREQGNIRFVKYGENNDVLSGAIFNLYKESDLTRLVPIDTATSKSNGEVLFSNVDFGNYVIVEVKAPNGYNINTNEIKVTIDTAETTVNANLGIFINTKIRGSIDITKVDRKDMRLLSGATIGLYDIGKNLITSAMTNASGLVNFDNLEFGTYYYREIIAPISYVLNNNWFEFTITEQGLVLKGLIENTKRTVGPGPETPETPEVPKPNVPFVPPVVPPFVPPVDPNVPVNPDVPLVPDNPFDNGEFDNGEFDNGEFDNSNRDDISGGDKVDQNDKDTLPKTGSSSPIMVYVIGILLIVFGINLSKKKEIN